MTVGLVALRTMVAALQARVVWEGRLARVAWPLAEVVVLVAAAAQRVYHG
jgi:hypothetical protein